MPASLYKALGDTSRAIFEEFLPLVDIVEHKNHLHVFADLAGFQYENVHANVRNSLLGSILTITAKRAALDPSGIVHLEERPLEVSRDVLLPLRIEKEDTERIQKKFGNGVLQVIIPVKGNGATIPIGDPQTPGLDSCDKETKAPEKQGDVKSPSKEGSETKAPEKQGDVKSPSKHY